MREATTRGGLLLPSHYCNSLLSPHHSLHASCYSLLITQAGASTESAHVASPLYIACEGGRADCVAVLLTAGPLTTHCMPCLLLAFGYWLLVTGYLLLATCYLIHTTYYLLLAAHDLPLRPSRYRLAATHYSLFTAYYLLLTTHYPLLTTHYSLLTTHDQPPFAPCYTASCSAEFGLRLVNGVVHL